jgi:hypothetical protein
MAAATLYDYLESNYFPVIDATASLNSVSHLQRLHPVNDTGANHDARNETSGNECVANCCNTDYSVDIYKALMQIIHRSLTSADL